MAKRGCGVACCPLSNFYFASGLFDLSQKTTHCVNVGLGTDIAGGYSPSMLSAQRTAVLTMKAKSHTGDVNSFDYQDAFHLATVGGAKALNLFENVGNFEVSKRFDAVCWEVGCGGGGVDIFQEDSNHDIFQKIMTNAGKEDIARVFVNGKDV